MAHILGETNFGFCFNLLIWHASDGGEALGLVNIMGDITVIGPIFRRFLLLEHNEYFKINHIDRNLVGYFGMCSGAMALSNQGTNVRAHR